MVAFHHHLLPVSFVERDTLETINKYSLTIDARRAIDTFLENGVQFAFHGHQHQPSMFTITDDNGKHGKAQLHIIADGCLADKERFNDSGRRSFYLYEIEEGQLRASLLETSREDSDKFEWQFSHDYEIGQLRPRINRERIRDWAEKYNRWIKRADDVRQFENISDNGSLSITDLVRLLVDNIADDGSVAYYAGKKERYRTSTLATILECVADINLFPYEDILVMQKKLMRLRNNEDELIRTSEVDDTIKKDEADLPAWGLDETPSVWTTSKSLIALFVTSYKPDCESEKNELIDSVLWLAKQQYSSGGWGYQFYKESKVCEASVPMTALALRALCLSLGQEYIRPCKDVNNIYNAIKKGAFYLIHRVKSENGEFYWEYNAKANLSASIWALQAINKAYPLLLVNETFKESGMKIQKKIESYEKQVMNYVIKHLPSEDSSETLSETFFIAPKGSSLKYKPNIEREKNFKSFTPFVLSYLITVNQEYIDTAEVRSMMKWVLKHEDTKWLIQDFNGESGNPCMISIAMAINIIVNWIQVVSNKALDDAISSLVDGSADIEM